MDEVKGNNILDISICIACHRPYLHKLSTLLNSINQSSYLPTQCIIGLSETSKEEGFALEKELNTKYDFNIIISSNNNKCYQAENRNRAISMADTKYVTICDADDMVHKNRLEIIYDIMESTNTLSLIHGFIYPSYIDRKRGEDIINNWELDLENVKIYDGLDLYDRAERQNTYIHLEFTGTICQHAYITFQRKIFINVEQDTREKFYRTEDSKFVRDILKQFGRKKTTMMFYDIPLIKYF